MIAVRTQFTGDDLPADRRAVRELIECAIPLSAGARNKTITREHTIARVESLTRQAEQQDVEPESYLGHWAHQLGTLGSGNHFIEVTEDEAGQVWLFLHSGSRGVGNKIAQHHIAVAQRLAEKWWIFLPDKDLAYLVEGTDEFWAYIRDMRWAQAFARAWPHPRWCARSPVRRGCRVRRRRVRLAAARTWRTSSARACRASVVPLPHLTPFAHPPRRAGA